MGEYTTCNTTLAMSILPHATSKRPMCISHFVGLSWLR